MKVLAPYVSAFPASTRIHRLCSSIHGIHKTFECTSSVRKLLNPTGADWSFGHPHILLMV